MSKQVALTARPRAGSGKGEARALRREGRVPAIAYGSELDPTPVSVDGRDLFHALHTDAGLNAIIRLDIDGQSHLTIARDLQRHPVRREVLHVDFVAIDQHRKIQVDVPIHLEGTAAGEEDGGVAEHTLFTLSVEVLPLEVPDSITLDISDMQVGDVKRVADLALPEGVTPLDDPDRTVVSVNIPALEVPEPEEVLEEGEEIEGEVEGEEAAGEAGVAEEAEAGGDDEGGED
jgi:large subunit ribosomal protein L25